MQGIVNVDFKLTSPDDKGRVDSIKAEFVKDPTHETYISSESYQFLLAILFFSFTSKESLNYKRVKSILKDFE